MSASAQENTEMQYQTDDNFQQAVLVIPAFEPSDVLVSTVAECTSHGFERIVIVNDGSDSSYDPIFNQCITFPGVTVLRNEQNEGKGYSLKRAFAHVYQSFPQASGVVTADADGQHLPVDIRKVADQLEASKRVSEQPLILGSRDFYAPEIPPRSRIGNRATTGLVKLLYGARIQDTQTGLRAIPMNQLPALQHVKGSRFEYEMNFLLDAVNRKIPIIEVPISTVYHNGENVQSHFRPIRDSVQVWFQILRFTLSSLAGALVDLSIYALIVTLFFAGPPDAFGITIAVVVARVCSGLTNYFLNRQLVFADGNKIRVSLTRYVILAAMIMTVSALGTVLLTFAFGGYAIFAKVLVDVGLYVLSFVMQKRWVFTRDLSLEE